MSRGLPSVSRVVGARARSGSRWLALVALGAAGFVLGGCGVKGAVEPPPSAHIAPATVEAAPPEPRAFDPLGSNYAGPNTTQRVISSGRSPPAVANAPTAHQSSFLDWLLN
ncbi:MAG: hypothetical protein AB7K64_23050 [Variibacter sp.]